MTNRNIIDMEKLNCVPSGRPFEFKDVVSETLSKEEHSEAGRIFKDKVDRGLFNNVAVRKDTGENRVVYEKL
jgi:hypothetical protein